MSNPDEDHIRKVLTRIESFILPSNEDRFDDSLRLKLPRSSKKELSSIPLERLEETLYEVALADHMRAMQTMYRDNYDDHQLGRELRGPGHEHDKLPLKELLQKMVEGRSRALALLKLCFGENSHAMVKGRIDLASSYALQGLWEQADERIVQALHQLVALEEYEANLLYRQRKRVSMVAAQRIVTVFQVLRNHALSQQGHIRRTVLQELAAAFADVDHNHPDQLQLIHPAKLITSISNFFNTTKSKLPLKQLSSSYFQDEFNKAHPSNHSNQASNHHKSSDIKSWGDMVYYLRNQCDVMRSWIQLVNFIILPQNKAVLMLPFKLCDPSNRNLAHPLQLSAIMMTFPSVAKLISGSNLVKLLSQMKVVIPLVVNAHTGSVQNLHAAQLFAAPPTSNNNSNNPPQQSVGYELPIILEEYLSYYLLECPSMAMEQQFPILQIQVLTLKGVCGINLAQHMPLAEEVLTKALHTLESIGFEHEVIACELYNAIAQMMISKYQQHMNQQKLKLKEDAEEWMCHQEEGKRVLRIQIKTLKKTLNYKSAPMPQAEIEYRAKAATLKNRIKFLFQRQEQLGDHSAIQQNLQAAYRYLIKAYEIVENYHGVYHPVVGTACLAVASVQNILKDFEDTREWLVRAIRTLEKASTVSNIIFFPIPFRAITFAQSQLSTVLMKLGHEEEAKKVLQKAAEFHVQQAQQQIHDFHASQRTVNLPIHAFSPDLVHPADNNGRGMERLVLPQNPHNNQNGDNTRLDSARSNNSHQSNNSSHHSKKPSNKINPREKHAPRSSSNNHNNNNEVDAKLHQLQLITSSAYNLVVPVILKNTQLDEEIHTTTHLISEIINLSLKDGDKYEASLHAEEIAKLVESAYGWDSLEAAEAYRQVGIRCMALEDWARSIKFLHQSVDAHAAIFSKSDPKFISVYKLYEKAKHARQQAALGLPIDSEPVDEGKDEPRGGGAESPQAPTAEAVEVKNTADEEFAVSADVLFANAASHLHDQVDHQIHLSHGSHPGTPLKLQPEHLHQSPRKSSAQISPRDNEYEDFEDFYPESPAVTSVPVSPQRANISPIKRL